VPALELLPGSAVVSLTTFGAAFADAPGSSRERGRAAVLNAGLVRFSGPGAPSRWHLKLIVELHKFVPLTSAVWKSVSLLPVSTGAPPCVLRKML
jgi:hypothetical protein